MSPEPEDWTRRWTIVGKELHAATMAEGEAERKLIEARRRVGAAMQMSIDLRTELRERANRG